MQQYYTESDIEEEGEGEDVKILAQSEEQGVIKLTLEEGEGETPKFGAFVKCNILIFGKNLVAYLLTNLFLKVNYILLKGETEIIEEKTIEFMIGEPVMRCLELAVKSMKKGEICKLKSTYEYAFSKYPPKEIGPVKEVLFKLKLEDFTYEKPENIPEHLSMMTLPSESKVGLAGEMKDKGNEKFTSGDYSEAIKLYGDGIKLIGLVNKTEVSEEVWKEGEKLSVTLKINLGACYLKLECFSQAARTLDAIKEKNAKVCFRLAKAYEALEDLSYAKSWLKKGLEYEPNNKEIQVEYKRLSSLAEKDRSGFTGMFL